jgi:uncharacterized protein (TIGR03083 family)
MPTILDKQKTVDLLRHEYAALAELSATLSDEQWDTPTCLPGWTVRDVVSHVIGTESMLSGIQPPAVDISRLTHMRNPIAEANEVWVESMRTLGGTEMCARLEEITTGRMAALDAMTQEEFDAPSWTPAGNDETYGRFMRIRHYDCYLHEHDVRAALGLASRPDVDDVRSALDEVATGLGYIVGRRARMPEGSRVRIDLTGPVPVTYLIAVDGRANVVVSFDGPPTVGLEMPAMLFLRLTGGRHDSGARPDGEIRYSGDRVLGAQLAAGLAFTI